MIEVSFFYGRKIRSSDVNQSPSWKQLCCNGRVEWKIRLKLAHFVFQYAMSSLIRSKGLNPDDSLIQMKPREGEPTLRTEDILKLIEDQGQSIAMIVFSGLQYYTGNQRLSLNVDDKKNVALILWISSDLILLKRARVTSFFRSLHTWQTCSWYWDQKS